MTPVLVTGATTALGRALCSALLAEPGEFTVLATGLEHAPSGLPRSDSFLYRRADLTRPREAHDLLFGVGAELGVRAVIHSAMHRSARHEGPEVRALNVEASRELLFLCERHPTVKRFVFRSSGSVYRIDPGRAILLVEEDPLELSPGAPQSVRDRVEADLTVCTRIGSSRLEIVVLRCAEILAADVGSQLFDYLESKLCLRPIGFDPMLNVLSLEDAVRPLIAAVRSKATGVFNIPGADTLPLSLAIELWDRTGLPVPGALLAPLYGFRASLLGMEFRYDLNRRRFHFSAVLDGRRARDGLGYAPAFPISWRRRTSRAPGR